MPSDQPYYDDYLPPTLVARLDAEAVPVPGVPGLRQSAELAAAFPDIDTPDALRFVVGVYEDVAADLREVLALRVRDRDFIDSYTAAAVSRNAGVAYLSPSYDTVIGARNPADGRVIVGPQPDEPPLAEHDRVSVPDFLRGPQVTLFGPPDTAKMSINAMNARHQVLPQGESELVGRLIDAGAAQRGSAAGQAYVPRWGADNEDSKTPIVSNLVAATKNLIGCYERTLEYADAAKGKHYRLHENHASLSIPLKRVPGLALPDGTHLLRGAPLPLHLYDFALHVFHNWRRPEALVFYFPKLETAEEAAYVRKMIAAAEARVASTLAPAAGAAYAPGTVKLFIVFENPRAIFRIREIARALAPHFVGGSLGWHDFLASTARLLKNDPNYRIPVKADPNIVINHIKESHQILARCLGPMGAVSIGGMYGVLFTDGDRESFEITMVGYIKDVITQLKRGLDGFWVAHPAFVRIGMALVAAWHGYAAAEAEAAGAGAGPEAGAAVDAARATLVTLIESVVPNDAERAPLLRFVFGADGAAGLSASDPLYPRRVLAADVDPATVDGGGGGGSGSIGGGKLSNSDESEVRYNIFQALQYIADWLGGNGCVALPAAMTNASGAQVFVRVMDDLATTERSRWEVWAEVRHGRVSAAEFERLLQAEAEFIRAAGGGTGGGGGTKRVQVQWQGEAARWYPVAIALFRQLVLDPTPPEFVTELGMVFTLPQVRAAANPMAVARELCPGKFKTEFGAGAAHSARL